MTQPAIDGAAWQESWDRQQEAYMPDREHRFTTMFDVVQTINGGRPPVILDPDRSTIVTANLASPQWNDALPRHDYDAVLTATALHWIAPDRLTALYAEIRDVLRSGGVFINADHMPDDGLPELSQRAATWEQARRQARWTTLASVMLLATMHVYLFARGSRLPNALDIVDPIAAGEAASGLTRTKIERAHGDF